MLYSAEMGPSDGQALQQDGASTQSTRGPTCQPQLGRQTRNHSVKRRKNALEIFHHGTENVELYLPTEDVFVIVVVKLGQQQSYF